MASASILALSMFKGGEVVYLGAGSLPSWISKMVRTQENTMNTTTPNEHPSAIVKVDTSNFSEEVLQSNEPVIVDFWKNGCQPCDMIAPFLEQIATELAGNVKVVTLNGEESPELAEQYGVRGYPTLALFKGGEVAVAAIDFRTGSFRASISNALASLRT